MNLPLLFYRRQKGLQWLPVVYQHNIDADVHGGKSAGDFDWNVDWIPVRGAWGPFCVELGTELWCSLSRVLTWQMVKMTAFLSVSGIIIQPTGCGALRELSKVAEGVWVYYQQQCGNTCVVWAAALLYVESEWRLRCDEGCILYIRYDEWRGTETGCFIRNYKYFQKKSCFSNKKSLDAKNWNDWPGVDLTRAGVVSFVIDII